MKAHLETAEAVLSHQHTRKTGLTGTEAAERLASYGANRLAEAKKDGLFARVWAQVREPMSLVLTAAAIVSGAFGEVADMAIILVVVALNCGLGIFQENKAEKAIEALQKMSAPHTRVRRDGAAQVVDTGCLVPGDIVLLEAGDAVPADLRVIEAASLRIEEAALTGESVAVEKTTAPLLEDVPLADRANTAYMGTSVVYGRGEGVVVATGMRTEIGRIAGVLSGTPEEKTPLQQRLADLGKVLSFLVLAVCAFIFLLDLFRGGDISGKRVLETLLTAVSLAVAAIPEGLVVVVTVLLSLGVTRMSQRNAIIRRLTAVETLGCTQIICSDKTGTLTQNRMTVVDSWGDGPLLREAMLHCNDVEQGPDGNLVGDPTQCAQKAFGLSLPGEAYPRLGEIPFDSNRKMMTTLHAAGGICRQYTTGAPDEILAQCAFILQDGEVAPLTAGARERILSENRRMAEKALRVLGAAYRDHGSLPPEHTPAALERDMVFAGLVGMIDPIRPEVRDAIDRCRTAGVRPIMITGDHRDTAVAIARELGILTGQDQAITGAELARLSDAEFEARVQTLVVYARVQPEHKVRIVSVWKKLGKITAMTGDGVNDAPAIKAADIGVGMGVTGTDVTKNVADMVLADDNFATIVYAVEEGRRIYENIRKALLFLLSSNLSEVLAIFVAILAGFRLFAPIHILWINLITDTFPAMALGMEEAEADSMERPPRSPQESVFAGGLGLEAALGGALIAALTLWGFFVGNRHSHAAGMTMAFLTLSFCELFHAVNARSRDKSIFRIRKQNKYLFAAIALTCVLTLSVLYLPGVNTIFQLIPLPAPDFFAAVGIALLIIPAIEVAKGIKRLAVRRGRRSR